MHTWLIFWQRWKCPSSVRPYTARARWWLRRSFEVGLQLQETRVLYAQRDLAVHRRTDNGYFYNGSPTSIVRSCLSKGAQLARFTTRFVNHSDIIVWRWTIYPGYSNGRWSTCYLCKVCDTVYHRTLLLCMLVHTHIEKKFHVNCMQIYNSRTGCIWHQPLQRASRAV